MRKFFPKDKKYKNIFLFSAGVFILVSFGLFYPQAAQAGLDITDKIAEFLSHILYLIAQLFGKILVAVIEMFIGIARYNNFGRAIAVNRGWVIVRDVCNMFFIAVLLMIAFGTIFKWETYRYNRLLPRLILMAFLINFSKFIALFLIDFSQVVMLTFVNAFSKIAAGSFVDAFGLGKMFQLMKSNTGTSNFSEVFGALLLANILLVIAIVVMVVLAIVLLMRILVLWLLIILSPLAFLARTWPGAGERTSAQWWQNFGKYLMVGPLLGFFVWLSLIVASEQGNMSDQINYQDLMAGTKSELEGGGIIEEIGGSVGDNFYTTISEISSTDNLLSFIIAICLLMGSLMVAQKMGVAGGQLAGQAQAKIGSTLSKGAKWAAAGAGGGILGIGAYGAWKGKKKMAGMAYGTAAFSPALKNVLGAVSKSRIPFIGSAAKKTAFRLSRKRDELREKAEKEVKLYDDPRLVKQQANSLSITPFGRAKKIAAQNRDPAEIRNKGAMLNHLDKMSEEDWKNVPSQSLAKLGAQGIDLPSTAALVLQSDGKARGAYNTGRMEYNSPGDTTGFIIGVDRYGTPLKKQAQYGFMANNPLSPPSPWDSDLRDKYMQRGKYSNKYKIVTKEERKKRERLKIGGQEEGEGNLSVGRFSRTADSSIGIDLKQLSPEIQEYLLKGAGEDPEEKSNLKYINGVEIRDKKGLGDIAANIIRMIDQEIAQKRKGGADESEIDDLEQAREKLNRPEELESLKLINSSAAGYKISDLKNTKIHEDLHGFGVDDEEACDRLTEFIIQNKIASRRQPMGEAYQAGKSVDEIIALEMKEMEKETKATKVVSRLELAKKGITAKGVSAARETKERVVSAVGTAKEQAGRPAASAVSRVSSWRKRRAEIKNQREYEKQTARAENLVKDKLEPKTGESVKKTKTWQEARRERKTLEGDYQQNQNKHRATRRNYNRQIEELNEKARVAASQGDLGQAGIFRDEAKEIQIQAKEADRKFENKIQDQKKAVKSAREKENKAFRDAQKETSLTESDQGKLEGILKKRRIAQFGEEDYQSYLEENLEKGISSAGGAEKYHQALQGQVDRINKELTSQAFELPLKIKLEMYTDLMEAKEQMKGLEQKMSAQKTAERGMEEKTLAPERAAEEKPSIREEISAEKVEVPSVAETVIKDEAVQKSAAKINEESESVEKEANNPSAFKDIIDRMGSSVSAFEQAVDSATKNMAENEKKITVGAVNNLTNNFKKQMQGITQAGFNNDQVMSLIREFKILSSYLQNLNSKISNKNKENEIKKPSDKQVEEEKKPKNRPSKNPNNKL